jgi:hypothetical protein
MTDPNGENLRTIRDLSSDPARLEKLVKLLIQYLNRNLPGIEAEVTCRDLIHRTRWPDEWKNDRRGAVTGNVNIDAHALIYYSINQGYIPDTDISALGSLLKQVREGVGREEAAFIDQIIKEFRLIPVPRPPRKSPLPTLPTPWERLPKWVQITVVVLLAWIILLPIVLFYVLDNELGCWYQRLNPEIQNYLLSSFIPFAAGSGLISILLAIIEIYINRAGANKQISDQLKQLFPPLFALACWIFITTLIISGYFLSISSITAGSYTNPKCTPTPTTTPTNTPTPTMSVAITPSTTPFQSVTPSPTLTHTPAPPPECVNATVKALEFGLINTAGGLDWVRYETPTIAIEASAIPGDLLIRPVFTSPEAPPKCICTWKALENGVTKIDDLRVNNSDCSVTIGNAKNMKIFSLQLAIPGRSKLDTFIVTIND